MSIKKLKKSFSYALKGIGHVFRNEQNFRIQVSVAVVMVAFALWLRLPATSFMILISTITLVLILEIINTAIERCLDIVKPRLSDQVEMIKDIMAGAVLLASLFAIIIGLCIFWPYRDTL